MLDRAGKLKIDGRLLLLGESLKARNWRAAELQIGKIEEDEIFSFLVPLLRAWLAQGSGKGDPTASLRELASNPLAAAYADEQRPLLLLASGRTKEGIAALRAALEEAGARAPRLRVAGASLLARKGEKAEALALLEGDSEVLVAARRRLQSGGRLAGEIATPSAGIAELLIRIAADLNSQDVPGLALQFARIATFLSPENSETWIATSDLLAATGQNEAALAALAKVTADDPFADLAEDSRIGLLVAAGRPADALARAKADVDDDPDNVAGWSRLGDLLNQMQRHGEAADAYGKALGLVKAGRDAAQPEWALLLLQGGALVQAGRWPEGKAALLASYELAPEQAVVLNYLGYSQLERRENVAEAERLIREASRLQPDDAAITDSLGWAHYLRGDLPKAIELLERAARGQPADAAIKEHLGDAYFKAGRRFEARYAWQAALVYAEGDAAGRLRAKVDAGLTPALNAP